MERFVCNRCHITKPESDFSSVARAQARAGDDNAWCQGCVSLMFNSRLSPTEALASLQEDTDRSLQKFRLPDQDFLSKEEARWGRPMHHTDFISKLRTIVPGLVVMEAPYTPNAFSLYLVKGEQVQYLGWMQQEYAPEFEVIITNERNLPVAQKRAWRTVLLRLIKAGIITEQEAQEVFGQPTDGEQAKFYREELWLFRNRRSA